LHFVQTQIAERRVNLQAILAHCIEMRAARDKSDIVSGGRQASAKIPAYAATADNRNLHSPSLY
jgi:hypothetical protein